MQQQQKIMSSGQPDSVAQWLLENVFVTSKGSPTLLYQAGGWWEWYKDRWEHRHREQIEDLLYVNLDDVYYTVPNMGPKRLVPEPIRIKAIMANLRAKVRREFKAVPTWVSGYSKQPHPSGLVAFKDVLVPLTGSLVLPRDVNWFDPGVLTVDYQPNAMCPLWMKCLDQWSMGDPQWITLLQRWFGYCITGHRDLGKWLMLYGKSRAGKGVVCRVLRELMGNVCNSRSLEDMVGDRGLAGLQSCRVLCLTEVSERKGDSERLGAITKRIIGKDPQRIDVKYQVPLENVVIGAAVMAVGNELPSISNKMGSISKKMLMLPFNWSALDSKCVDPQLENKLIEELEGIGAWAMQGAIDLEAEQVFEQKFPVPEAAAEASRAFVSKNSLMDAFLEDKFVKADGFVLSRIIWSQLETYCRENRVGMPLANPKLLRKRILEETSWVLSPATKANEKGLVGLALKKDTDE